MRKRIITGTFILCMCISLVGCGGTGSSPSEDVDINPSQNKNENLNTEFDSDALIGMDTETNVETENVSDISISSDSQDDSKETETIETEVKQTEENQTEEVETSETEEKQTEETDTPEPDIPSNCGALRVEGNLLCDEVGDKVFLHGLSTHGLSWYPEYVNEEALKEFREKWGANVIRLAMYTAEYNGYCTGGDKEGLKELIRKGVEYATNCDMYVIVDWHILSDGNPQMYETEAIEFFQEMSAEFADHNNVLYEICNEPNGGVSWSSIKAYAEKVIPVIRANDSDAIIIVGTPNWSQQVAEAVNDPITGYENIMYALHFYAATHTDWLRGEMEKAALAGLPIMVTEFGICDASGNGAINTEEADKWIAQMNDLAISYCGWNISNKGETSAIFKTSCNKTSGWTEENLSESGKWMYEMLKGTKLGD